jgi:hypothetical protein
MDEKKPEDHDGGNEKIVHWLKYLISEDKKNKEEIAHLKSRIEDLEKKAELLANGLLGIYEKKN